MGASNGNAQALSFVAEAGGKVPEAARKLPPG